MPYPRTEIISPGFGLVPEPLAGMPPTNIFEVYEEFLAKNCQYAICATKDDILCGVGVFDAKKHMEIVDITVLPEYRGILEEKLLNVILQIFYNLPCEDISMDIYSDHGTGLYYCGEKISLQIIWFMLNSTIYC